MPRPLFSPGGDVEPRGAAGRRLRGALALLASDAVAAQPPVSLGTAAGFAVLAGQTVTNSGPSTLNGDLGVSPGTAVTGFRAPGVVNGTIHAGGTVASQAQADLQTGYDDAAARAPALPVFSDLGGLTLPAGVYKSASSLSLTGALTLDAHGDPNAVFVFQAASTLTTAPASRVQLINGAQPCNVFWQTGSSASLGTASVFAGNILASQSIAMGNGVMLSGRALARHGSITLINDTITAAHCAAGAPGPSATTGSCTATTPVKHRPARPILRKPREHAHVHPGSVKFRWHQAARAAGYTLIVDRQRKNTGCATRAVMRVRAGSHRYRVLARNRRGARSSPPRVFLARAAAHSSPRSPACISGKPKKHRKHKHRTSRRPRCSFIKRVRAHMPILHVDRTDGFPLKDLNAVFAYRALESGTQPRRTCLRNNTYSDDSACPRGHLAHLSDLTPRSSVNHIDYPARFNTDQQHALAARYRGRPTMYFYAKRDSANRKTYTYWFFYSYNYFVSTVGSCGFLGACVQKQMDLHEGDFERISVITDAHDKPVLYQFYAHRFHVNYRANDRRLQLNRRVDHIPGYGGHVRVYAGHGSHASETGCGLYDTRRFGQRDRTCSKDPYSDDTSTPAKATVAFTPANTAIRDLAPQKAHWACFPGRLGAGAHGFTAGDSPNAPLAQSDDCPSRSRTVTARSVQTPAAGQDGYATSTNVFDGVDRCADWETPPVSPGFQLVVCNQHVLSYSLAGSKPTAPPNHAEIAGSTSPTAKDVPAYTNQPDANALQSTSIVAPAADPSNPTPPHDIYVAQSRPGTTSLEALFRAVSVPTAGLRIDASGATWKLTDNHGKIIETQLPHEVPAVRKGE